MRYEMLHTVYNFKVSEHLDRIRAISFAPAQRIMEVNYYLPTETYICFHKTNDYYHLNEHTSKIHLLVDIKTQKCFLTDHGIRFRCCRAF